MPRSSAPPVISNLGELHPPFLDVVQQLLAMAASDNLPVRVFETRRSLVRQEWLFKNGFSRAAGANGPHPWGLAVDIILEPKHDYWSAQGVKADGRPQKAGGGGAEWDTGVELRGSSCVVVRPAVVEVCRRLGAMAELHGLTWGGRNEGPWSSRRPGDLFGWDPYHFQMKGWAKLVESGAVKPPR
jgi:hypothetical protein